jgi:hypothetical protein
MLVVAQETEQAVLKHREVGEQLKELQGLLIQEQELAVMVVLTAVQEL